MHGLHFPCSLPPPLFLHWLVFFHLLLAVSLLSDVFGVFLISACVVCSVLFILFYFIIFWLLHFQVFHW
jgi:hypothetical protein